MGVPPRGYIVRTPCRKEVELYGSLSYNTGVFTLCIHSSMHRVQPLFFLFRNIWERTLGLHFVRSGGCKIFFSKVQIISLKNEKYFFFNGPVHNAYSKKVWVYSLAFQFICIWSLYSSLPAAIILSLFSGLPITIY